jgi:hypothetical protein
MEFPIDDTGLLPSLLIGMIDNEVLSCLKHKLPYLYVQVLNFLKPNSFSSWSLRETPHEKNKASCTALGTEE